MRVREQIRPEGAKARCGRCNGWILKNERKTQEGWTEYGGNLYNYTIHLRKCEKRSLYEE